MTRNNLSCNALSVVDYLSNCCEKKRKSWEICTRNTSVSSVWISEDVHIPR